jgi:hypothetical protein
MFFIMLIIFNVEIIRARLTEVTSKYNDEKFKLYLLIRSVTVVHGHDLYHSDMKMYMLNTSVNI